MLRVQLNKFDCNALLDTGCTNSVISEKLALKVNANIIYAAPGSGETLISANGGGMTVIGHTCIDINAGGLIIPFNFAVLKYISQSLIFGMDFLEYTNANMCWSQHTISFFGMVVLPVLNASSCDNIVLLLRQTTLPPRSESLVPVRFKKEMGGMGIIEPIMAFSKQEYSVGKIIVNIKPKNRTTFCQILNPTDFHLTIKRNRPVGKLTNMDDVTQILDWEEPESSTGGNNGREETKMGSTGSSTIYPISSSSQPLPAQSPSQQENARPTDNLSVVSELGIPIQATWTPEQKGHARTFGQKQRGLRHFNAGSGKDHSALPQNRYRGCCSYIPSAVQSVARCENRNRETSR